MNPINWRKEKAQGMVEFALILPLLLLVMFAIIEFGRLLFVYSAVFSSARDAVRYGVGTGSLGDYNTSYYRDCTGMRAAARRFGSLVGIQDTDILIWHDDGEPHDPNLSASQEFVYWHDIDPLDPLEPRRACWSHEPTIPDDIVDRGDRVNVDVTATYQPILPLVNLPPITIRSRASRTVLKDISISGTPSAPTGSVGVCFTSTDMEVDEDAGEAVVTVYLSGLYAEDIWVPYFVNDGTALLNVDYGTAHQGDEEYNVGTPGMLLIRSGYTGATIHIPILEDPLDEDSETIRVTLGDPGDASACANTFFVNIKDNDPPPTVSFTLNGQTVGEPVNGSSIPVSLTVVLGSVSGRNVSVYFGIDPLNSTGAMGLDYTYDTATPLVIPAGDTTATRVMQVNGDGMDEDIETVGVVIADQTWLNDNALPGSPIQHDVTITDNIADLPPTVYFTWERQAIPEDIPTGSYPVQVRLSAASGRVINLPFSLSGTAALGQDYGIILPAPSTPSELVIAPGLNTVNIPVDIYDDNQLEPGETITITMGTPSNASLVTPYNSSFPSIHTIEIMTQIPPPVVYFEPGSTITVNESGGRASVEVKLLASYPIPVVVDIGSALGSTAGNLDYSAIWPGGAGNRVTIPAGSRGATIQISTANDLIDEEDEIIQLNILPSPGSRIPAYVVGSPSSQAINIVDDDDPPLVYFTSPDQSENEDAGTLHVNVGLSAMSGKNVVVPYTVSGSATQGSDFNLSPASPLVIPAGSLSGTIDVDIINDDNPSDQTTLGEPEETIILTLGLPLLNTAGLGSPTVNTTSITPWSCPTASAPSLVHANGQRYNLVWVFTSDRSPLRLTQVSVSWPIPVQGDVTNIAFGAATLWSGTNSTGNLTVSTPSPLWTGSFSSQQMTFSFSRNPGAGNTRVTARFEHCRDLIGNINQ